MDSNFDFLEVYDNVLSKEECDYLIDAFEEIDPLSDRKVYGIDNDAKKVATSLYCNLKDEFFKDFNKLICKGLHGGLPFYKDKYSFIEKIPAWQFYEWYNIQKYEEGEGYYSLHCEHQPTDPQRIIVWMIYLNDAECGTEFSYQDIVMDARVGSLVLWPAGWTHPHKGVTPNKGLKYIATGWFSYSEK